MRQRVIKAAVGLTLVVAAIVGLATPLVFGDRGKGRRDFESAAWRQSLPAASSGRCDDGLRSSMVYDLIGRLLDPGLTPQEVTVLLGRPGATDVTGSRTLSTWTTSTDQKDGMCRTLRVAFDDGMLVSAEEVKP